MDGGGGSSPHPSNPKRLWKSATEVSSGELPVTPISEPTSNSPATPGIAPSRSLPSLATDDTYVPRNVNKSKSKGKVVDDSGSSTNNNNEDGNNNGTGKGATGADASVQGEGVPAATREQDRYLPIANVIRLMRKILPTYAKISDDTKESVQECVSEFIGFITGEANERCRLEQRKTITAEDLLCSMAKLGFDDYVGPLALYLQRYRESEGGVGVARASHRGSETLPSLKRTASDAGLYVEQQYHQQPPAPPPLPQTYPFMVSNIPQNPSLLQPQALFPGGGGTSFTVPVEQRRQPPMGPPPVTMNYLFSDIQLPPRAYRAAPGPAADYRDAAVYMDMGGASSSSQTADPSQHPPLPFYAFDPCSANK